MRELGFNLNELHTLPRRPAPQPLRQLHKHNSDGSYNFEGLFHTVVPIPDRVNDLEYRTERIEETLNLILERLSNGPPPNRPPTNSQPPVNKNPLKKSLFSKSSANKFPVNTSLANVSSTKKVTLAGSPYNFRPLDASRNELQIAAREVISRKQSLDILSGCQNPEHLNGFPSWVPNLLVDWKACPFGAKNPVSEVPPTSGDMNFGFDRKNNSILLAKGRRVGSIVVCSADTLSRSDSMEHLEGLCANWRHLAANIASNSKTDPVSRKMLEDLNGDNRYQHWLRFVSLGAGFGDDWSGSEKEQIFQYLWLYGSGRKLGFLDDGSYGLVPGDSKVGDQICYFPRTTFPYVLRKVGRGKYVAVGEACKYTISV